MLKVLLKQKGFSFHLCDHVRFRTPSRRVVNNPLNVSLCTYIYYLNECVTMIIYSMHSCLAPYQGLLPTPMAHNHDHE